MAMQSIRLYTAIFVAFALYGLSAGAQPTEHPDETVVVERYSGVEKWKLYPYLWTDVQMNVTCPGFTDFSVYVGQSEDDVYRKHENLEKAWCGWERLFGGGSETCLVHITPFGNWTVRVALPAKRHFSGSSSTQPCRFHVQRSPSQLLMVLGLAGTALFWNADFLSSSTAFRISAGALGFTLVSVLLAMFIIYRTIPNKKRVALAFGLFGSSFLGAVRFMFGTWIPSFYQLIHNKIVLAYLVASGLLGLAITYYYDEPTNVKMNTIVRTALQLAGLTMVSFSTTLPEASVSIACVLIATKFLEAGFYRWRRRQQAIRLQQQQFQAEAAQRTPPQYYTEVDVPAAGSLAPGLQHYPVVAGVRQVAPVRMKPRHERVSLSEYYSQAQAVPLPAPDGEQQLQPAAPSSRPASAAAPTPSGLSISTQSGLSNSQQRSSRSARRPTAGESTPLASDAPQPQLSPLVQKGLVFNVETGRTINIGKGRYNQLLEAGYLVDQAAGTITPPPGYKSKPSPKRRSN